MNSMDKMFALTRGMVEIQSKIDRTIGSTPNFLKPSVSQMALHALEREKSYSKLGIASLMGPLSAAQVIAQTSPKYNNTIWGNSAAELLNHKSAKYNTIFGSSTVLAAMALLDKKSATTSMHDLMENTVARALYEKQQNLLSKLGNQFFEVNQLLTPQWLTSIASRRTYDEKSTNLFDAISASSLVTIMSTADKADNSYDSVEDSMNQIEEILSDATLVPEVNKLMSSMGKTIGKKKVKATIKDFNEIAETRKLFKLFIHNHLFVRIGFTPQTTSIFSDIFESLFNLIIIGMVLSPLGEKMLQPLLGLNEKPIPQIVNKTVIHKHYKKVYSYSFGNRIDIAVSDCKVYLRSSTKTKCLGTLMKGTTVEVLQDKPNWSFIRANIECFDKKRKFTTTCLLQAWVRKSNLEGLQNND